MRSAWPNVWSIDEGTNDTELTVPHVELRGVVARARTLLRVDGVDPDQQPYAWFEVIARLHLEDDTAVFLP